MAFTSILSIFVAACSMMILILTIESPQMEETLNALSVVITGCKYREDAMFILGQAVLSPSHIISASSESHISLNTSHNNNILAPGRSCAQPLVPYAVLPHVKKYISNNHRNVTKPLVLYLVGPSGTGKTSLASRLARITSHSYTSTVVTRDEGRTTSPLLDVLFNSDFSGMQLREQFVPDVTQNAASPPTERIEEVDRATDHPDRSHDVLGDFCLTVRHHRHACPSGVFILDDAHEAVDASILANIASAQSAYAREGSRDAWTDTGAALLEGSNGCLRALLEENIVTDSGACGVKTATLPLSSDPSEHAHNACSDPPPRPIFVIVSRAHERLLTQYTAATIDTAQRDAMDRDAPHAYTMSEEYTLAEGRAYPVGNIMRDDVKAHISGHELAARHLRAIREVLIAAGDPIVAMSNVVVVPFLPVPANAAHCCVETGMERLRDAIAAAVHEKEKKRTEELVKHGDHHDSVGAVVGTLKTLLQHIWDWWSQWWKDVWDFEQLYDHPLSKQLRQAPNTDLFVNIRPAVGEELWDRNKSREWTKRGAYSRGQTCDDLYSPGTREDWMTLSNNDSRHDEFSSISPQHQPWFCDIVSRIMAISCQCNKGIEFSRGGCAQFGTAPLWWLAESGYGREARDGNILLNRDYSILSPNEIKKPV